jgi:hypothetical protein
MQGFKIDHLQKTTRVPASLSISFTKLMISKRGQTVAGVLVAAAIGAAVMVGLVTVLTQFEAVRLADTRESDLKTLIQLTHLSLDPLSSADTCGQAFAGSTLTVSGSTIAFTPNPSVPLTLKLGSGPGNNFLAANQQFGPWTAQSFAVELNECKTVDSPGSAPLNCLTPANSMVRAEFYGHFVLTLQSFNPIRKLPETKVERFPLRLTTNTPTNSGSNRIYPVTGCNNASTTTTTPGTPPTSEEICRSLCFIDSTNPLPNSGSVPCWNGIECNLTPQVCSALGDSAPLGTLSTATTCDLNAIRIQTIATGTNCTAPRLAKGFRMNDPNSSPGVENLSCTNVLEATTSPTLPPCQDCWTLANSGSLNPLENGGECGTNTRWVRWSPTGFVEQFNCGFPLGEICQRRRNGC